MRSYKELLKHNASLSEIVELYPDSTPAWDS